MKTLQKILVLCLVAALALSLFACGKKEESEQEENTQKPAGQTNDPPAEQIVESAPGTLTIIADSRVILGYNENGKAVAVTGENELGNTIAAACTDISGKPVADAVTMILQAMSENQAIIEKPYVVIRQDLNSMTPDEDFLAGIQAAAEKELGSSVTVVGIDQLDDDGYFDQATAKQILLSYLGEGATITAASVMIDGQYIITAEKDGIKADYQVVGHSGTVAPYVEVADDPMDEEGMIPEDEQFGTETDTPVDETEGENPSTGPEQEEVIVFPEDDEEIIG